ncbi:hypothetical protein EON62_00060 [archaeon]|nr:MAG: hypothetical protein EON62_00060 [archaeon]
MVDLLYDADGDEDEDESDEEGGPVGGAVKAAKPKAGSHIGGASASSNAAARTAAVGTRGAIPVATVDVSTPGSASDEDGSARDAHESKRVRM